MLWALLLLPSVGAAVAFLLRANAPRRAWLMLCAVGHLALVAAAWRAQPAPIAWGSIALDPAGLLFLSIASVLFLLASIYALGYLAHAAAMRPPEERQFESPPFTNYPEATFTACLLAFLATMTLVTVSRHLGLLWVAIEATTLASAPLIYFHRDRRSLEATWKYLVICSVGIALALLGNFFLAVAARAADGSTLPLTIEALSARAGELNPQWLKAAFLLLLVGYGTKMGLAPLHTWLPDAHSESPSLVSALLSGALLNCALLAILRNHALLSAAGLAPFSRDLLVLFGLISMVVAAVFIIGQRDLKRLLAYSSVEHMGVLALGVGLGGIAGFGSMFHAVNHSLTKGMLFLLAGNVLAVFQTKSVGRVRELTRRMPLTGLLWACGLLAITGVPPFGTFVSELAILKGAVEAGAYGTMAVYLAALAVIFVGMLGVLIETIYQPANEAAAATPIREPLWSVLPPGLLAGGALLLGVYLPPGLDAALRAAAACLAA